MDEFTVDHDGDPIEGEFELHDSERKYRSLGMIAIAGVIAAFGTLLLINSLPEVGEVTALTLYNDSAGAVSRAARRVELTVAPPPLVLSRMKPLDTVYTTDSIYLDVNLTKQNVTVHFRSGDRHTFRISSGNKNIPEGIATPTGLFTVQNMQPLAISKQFNNAKLHHWIGIQGGVGFHGLDGSGYYATLGVRPSSHGCVRMSREEVAEMYNMVHPGALIMVHYGNPARIVTFCNSSDTVGARVIDSAAVYNRALGKDRIRALYDGRYWVDPQPRLVHLARQRVRWGLDIGEASRIPKQQIPRTTFLADFIASPSAWQADRSGVETLRGNTYFAMQRLADSSRNALHAQVKAEDEKAKNVEFGE